MCGERSKGLDACPSRDHGGPQPFVAGLRRRDLGNAEAVRVVGQHDDVAAPGSPHPRKHLAGRGAAPRTTVHDCGTGGLEQLPEPVPGHHGHDAAALGGQRGRPGEGGVAEVRHPDAVRTSGLDAGLDGGADVVDVNVDVPGGLTTDDDQRVTEHCQRRAQLGDRRLRRVEEVHDLVGGAAARHRSFLAARDSGPRDLPRPARSP